MVPCLLLILIQTGFYIIRLSSLSTHFEFLEELGTFTGTFVEGSTFQYIKLDTARNKP